MSKAESIDVLKMKMKPLGFRFEELQLGTPARSYTRITSQKGNSIVISTSSPLYPFATASARTVYKDKLKLYDLAALLDLQVPRTMVLESSDIYVRKAEVENFLSRYTNVIVKPSSSHGSRGITRDVKSLLEVESAVAVASLESGVTLIQQQFIGEEIRFAVVGGKVRAAILREKAAVIGDGVSSLRQLINADNKSRSLISDTMVPYPKLNAMLIDRHAIKYSDHIIPNGERVELSKSTMIREGASIYDVTSTIHDDYVAIVERLSSQFGSGFIAVDVMVSDYASKSSDSNYIILEINTNPALSLFYSCRDGSHVQIVEKYLADAFEYVLDGWPL